MCRPAPTRCGHSYGEWTDRRLRMSDESTCTHGRHTGNGARGNNIRFGRHSYGECVGRRQRWTATHTVSGPTGAYEGRADRHAHSDVTRDDIPSGPPLTSSGSVEAIRYAACGARLAGTRSHSYGEWGGTSGSYRHSHGECVGRYARRLRRPVPLASGPPGPVRWLPSHGDGSYATPHNRALESVTTSAGGPKHVD